MLGKIKQCSKLIGKIKKFGINCYFFICIPVYCYDSHNSTSKWNNFEIHHIAQLFRSKTTDFTELKMKKSFHIVHLVFIFINFSLGFVYLSLLPNILSTFCIRWITFWYQESSDSWYHIDGYSMATANWKKKSGKKWYW